MDKKLDRTKILFGKADEVEKTESEYRKKQTPQEKLRTITYLRECFYGDEATSGRLQRVYTIIKRK